jgi:methylated-DNA-[protein]-cysteine S-methyltransferase
MTPLSTATVATPCGPFSVAVNNSGALVAAAFGDLVVLATRTPEKYPLSGDTSGVCHDFLHAVEAYFAGQRQDFHVRLAAEGTPFQQRVWAALATIPFGETRSYGQLAAELGQPGAARAVGRANATNPLALFVPCHRVINGNGALNGYAFGPTIKRQLLDFERARKDCPTDVQLRKRRVHS